MFGTAISGLSAACLLGFPVEHAENVPARSEEVAGKGGVRGHAGEDPCAELALSETNPQEKRFSSRITVITRRRLDEWEDAGHGARAAAFLLTLRGRYFWVTDRELELLVQACELHSEGLMEGDGTVRTCWDADRLDLGRVGIRPRARYLCTEAARDPEVLDGAYRRSRADR